MKDKGRGSVNGREEKRKKESREEAKYKERREDGRRKREARGKKTGEK